MKDNNFESINKLIKKKLLYNVIFFIFIHWLLENAKKSLKKNNTLK